MNRIIVAVLSDTHGGFKGALMNPNTVLWDENIEGDLVPYHPKMTASQEHLWKIFKGGVQALNNFANGDHVILIHNGDLTHGKRHEDMWVSNRPSDHITIAVDNMNYLADNVNNLAQIYLVRGTGAHDFGFGTSEILVGQQLKKEHGHRMFIDVLTHGLLNVYGVEIDYAHHGPPPGIRNWLRGNVARYYLRSLMADDVENGKRPPRLVLRGHVHAPILEHVKHMGYNSTLLTTPSFSMINDFGKQVTRSAAWLAHGMAAVEIVDGEVGRIKEWYQKVDTRRKVNYEHRTAS